VGWLMPQSGVSHDLLVGRTNNENSHPQYVSKRFFEAVLEGLVPAAKAPWGALPDTGADMTTQIQAALNGGANFFRPGTYVVSSGLSLTTNQFIWAEDVVFDYGSTVLGSAAFRVGSGAGTVQRARVFGLKLLRSYTSTDVTTWLYTGFRVSPAFEGQFVGLEAEGFEDGFLLEGDSGLGSGCTYNFFELLKSFNCKYALHLRATGANDFVNENFFGRCRLLISSGAVIPDAQRKTCKYIWIERQAASGHAPNNNVFQHITLEGFVGRKVQCEGLDNLFLQCRYENRGSQWVASLGGGYTNNNVDIQIGNADFVSGQFTRNRFIGGTDLNGLIDDKAAGTVTAIDFYDSTHAAGGGINNKNQFESGWGTMYAGGNTAPLVSYHGGSDTTDMIEHKMVTGAASRTMLTRAQAPDGKFGFLGFYDNSTTLRNYLGLATSTLNGIWDLVVNQGLRVGGVAQMYTSSNDMLVFPIVSGGRVVFVGNSASDTPVLVARNSSSSQRSFSLNTSGDALTLAMIANPSTQYGAIAWYNGSSTERNRLFMKSSSPYQLAVDGSLIVNFRGSDAESFVVYDGSGSATPFLQTILNTSPIRFIIGSATPASTDNSVLIAGAGITIRGPLDIDASNTYAVNSAISLSACYVGLTAGGLTMTLQAVASFSTGHVIIIKDESGAGGHTIDGNGAETIDGALTYALGAYQSITLLVRNGAWWVI
jgi:hypothetical protein